MIRKATAQELLKLKKVTFNSVARVVRVNLKAEEKRLRSENFSTVSEQVKELREKADAVRKTLISPDDLMEFLKRNDTEIKAKAIRAKSRNALNAQLTVLKTEAASEIQELANAIADGNVMTVLETAVNAEEE